MKAARPFNLWRLIRSQWLLLLAIGLYGWAFATSPGKAAAALSLAGDRLLSVAPLVLAVMGLIGLLQVWISSDLVARLLGREAGLRGLLTAVLCGTILIGPAYLIFPLLLSFRKQGARWAVIVIVLASYAVKLQMIPIEVGFLGWKFSALRIGLTLLLAIPLGLLMERFLEKSA